MIVLSDTCWLQYDSQIGTFRGECNSIIHGTYTNEITTAEALVESMGVTLSPQELVDLQAEKVD